MVMAWYTWYTEAVLELQDHDGAADQQDHIRPPRFQRQLVLEDGRALLGGGIDLAELPHLLLKQGDGVVPGAELLIRGIGDEVAESGSDHAGLRVPELGEERVPPVIRLGRIGWLQPQGFLSPE